MKQTNHTSMLWRIQKQPTQVVSKLLASIPRSVLLDCTKTIADLAMGDGSYLAEVARLRVENGSTPEEAQGTLYGFETSSVYLAAARRLNGLHDAKLAILKPDKDLDSFNMKFDVIIGNPPFQEVVENKRKDQASNLWSKFWVKSLELTKDSGIVSLITPTSWLSPSANLRGKLKFNGKNRLWDVFDSFTSVAQVTGIDAYFKGVGSSFGVVTVDKSGSDGLSFVEGYSTTLGFLPKGDVEGVTKKLKGEKTLNDFFTVNQECGNGWRVSTPLTRKVNEASVEILKNSETPVSGSKRVGLYLYTHVNSEAEALKVREVILNSSEILNSHCRWSGFMNIQIFKMLSV